ncbi:MAG: flavoprotein, partial [Xanthobacteraceae bacterium]
MASITIRQLDEALKKRLRLRAARNGRSMEDEVRVLLREAADGDAVPVRDEKPAARKSRGKRTEPDAGIARILLIIGGGIAAYKSLDLIRRLRERNLHVRVILTKAAQEFITPLSAGAIAGERVFTDLFDPDGEFDVGHIRLARDADVVVVAPATADLMAKLANGMASDLASAVLLATGARVLLAPAMNPHMWANKATRRNRARLEADGFAFVGPNEGEMAESGERGLGRKAVPRAFAAAIERLLHTATQRPLAGKRIVNTSGPTHEPIDPVRYIANRSSGKQGHAI